MLASKRSSGTLRTEATVTLNNVNTNTANASAKQPSRRQSLTNASMQSVRAFFGSSSSAHLNAMPSDGNGEASVPSLPSSASAHHQQSQSSMVLLRRVSATRRAQTDRLLADVFSQPLLAARAHAAAHSEGLFRDPPGAPSGSSHGLGVGALARNKLKRESVLMSLPTTPRSMNVPLPGTNATGSRAPSVCGSTVSDAASSVATALPLGAANGKKTPAYARSTLGSQIAVSTGSSTTNGNGPREREHEHEHEVSPPDSPRTVTTSSHAHVPMIHLGHGPGPEVRVAGSDADDGAEDLPGSDAATFAGVGSVGVMGVALDLGGRPKRARSFIGGGLSLFGRSASQRYAAAGATGTPSRTPSLSLPGRGMTPSPAPSSTQSRASSRERTVSMGTNVLSRLWKSPSFAKRKDRAQREGAMELLPGTTQGKTSPSLLARSSSLFAPSALSVSGTGSAPRRPAYSWRAESSSSAFSSSTQTSSTSASHSPTPTPRIKADDYLRPVRSSAGGAGVSAGSSLGRSIKYRLFPGSLVPLAPPTPTR